MAPLPVLTDPFKSPANLKSFSLDVSGIAGFFGGEEAYAAMSSLHVVPNRRYLGWYNSPGSYFIAKKYGTLPKSPFWDGLFPGPTVTPAKLVELDSNVGWRYTGLQSGTQLSATSHLSSLLTSYCTEHHTPSDPPRPLDPGQPDSADQIHRDIVVSIIKISDFPVKDWPADNAIPRHAFPTFTVTGILLLVFTIFFSVACTVISALYQDWFSFSLILLGILSNGISCFVFGSGVLKLVRTQPSPNSPPENGVFFDNNNIVIMEGPARSVSTLLYSRFKLELGGGKSTYKKIGLCSVLLMAQFLFQLFLMPQATLVGQILFISTLAVSWVCNGYFSSVDKEDVQRLILFKIMESPPKVFRFPVTKWTTAVVFTVFYSNPVSPRGVLDELMPNNTPAWNVWKDCISASVARNIRPSDILLSMLPEADLSESRVDRKICFPDISEAFRQLSDGDKKLIAEFLRTADKPFDCIKEARKDSNFTDANITLNKTIFKGSSSKNSADMGKIDTYGYRAPSEVTLLEDQHLKRPVNGPIPV